MTEALPVAMGYGFDTLHLHSIEANVDPLNSQSVLLLERVGFVKEAHFRESDFYNGKFNDRAVYSLRR